MLNGLYVATSGLVAQESRVNTISNNLANINTTGFKRDRPVFSMYMPGDKRWPQSIIKSTVYNKSINSVVKLDDIYSDFSSGSLRETENKLDVALKNKDAFFAVETSFGIRFTRDGHFSLNSDGELVTKDGFHVLSSDYQNDPVITIPQVGELFINDSVITIPQDEELFITENGEILLDDLLQNQLYIVEFPEKHNLQKTGRNLYQAVEMLPVASANPMVSQGYLETSNINPVEEMVKMIDALRSFETYQKVIQTLDSVNEIASNRIGRMA